ncbi:MAG TPA: hypothetical protein VEX41_03125, partial [Candidatus Eisenbacteria bacterium]|nr:hypothetical protein [Candidatus Eisenbacteria bacterium]
TPDIDPSKVLLRISAQRYNEAADYERLAEALVRRGFARTAAAPGATATSSTTAAWSTAGAQTAQAAARPRSAIVEG